MAENKDVEENVPKTVESGKSGKRKSRNRMITIYSIIAAALIIAPWAYVAVLLTESDEPTTKIDLICTNVNLSPCNSHDDCVIEAKKMMDQCGVLDTHNDLPYTYAKFQDPENPTVESKTPIGVNVDADHMDLRKEEVLNGANKHTNLRLMKEGRLTGQFWSIYVSCATNFKDGVDWALEQIDITHRMIEKYDEFQFVTTPYEAKQAMNNGKVASMFGMEGGHMIGSRLSILRQLFNLGIRYMTLTHNCNTPWADENNADVNTDLIRNNGLSDFGKDLIREMNRLGMLVDLSHVSAATMKDTLEIAEAPVIFSHSSSREVNNHQRNVPDDVLDELKLNGGVICITFVPSFIKSEADMLATGNANVSDIADHFDHIKQRIGAEHLCIGGDYNGVSSLPIGAEDVGKYPNLIAELLLRGWTQTELQGILQENIFRAWADAYAVAEDHKQRGTKADWQWLAEDQYEEPETECKMIVA